MKKSLWAVAVLFVMSASQACFAQTVGRITTFEELSKIRVGQIGTFPPVGPPFQVAFEDEAAIEDFEGGYTLEVIQVISATELVVQAVSVRVAERETGDSNGSSSSENDRGRPRESRGIIMRIDFTVPVNRPVGFRGFIDPAIVFLVQDVEFIRNRSRPRSRPYPRYVLVAQFP